MVTSLTDLQSRIRLVLADTPTIDPRIVRKILKKRDREGIESLSSREQKILDSYERAETRNQSGPPQEIAGGGDDLFSFSTGEAWERFLTKEQWDKVPDDKKPQMLKWFQERIKADREDPGSRERGKRDVGEDYIVEEGDNVAQTKMAARKLLLKIKNIRRRADDNMKSLAGSEDPAKRAAAKELSSLVPQALDPLSQSEELLKRINPVLEEINPQNARAKLRLADQAVTEGLMGFRTWGSQLNEVFGEYRNKNADAAKKLKSVAGTRYKAAIRQLREQGMAPEQAAQQARSIPALQKMMTFIKGAEAKVEAYDLVLHEMASIYDSSRKTMKDLQESLKAMQASFSNEKAASRSKISERLTRVAKTIILMKYLELTSKSPSVTQGTGNGVGP